MRTVTVEVESDPEALTWQFRTEAGRMLSRIGLELVDEEAEAVLELDVISKGVGRSYQGVGTCYRGAQTTVTVTLVFPDGTALTGRESGEVPNPAMTFDCPKDPAEAPHRWSFEQAFLEALVARWGEGAVPVLFDVLSGRIGTSAWDLPNRTAALDAFGTLDYEKIDLEDLAAFARAGIDLLDLLVEKGWTDHGAKQAARRFLTSLSEKDFGSATAADIAAWRAWYDDWYQRTREEREAAGA